MTRTEKLLACKKQYLYDSFYDDYMSLLLRLYSNKQFMDQIRKVSERTAEPLLFGIGIDVNPQMANRFQEFKNEFCNIFFDTLKFSDFPEYKEIYYSIKNSGHSGKSATISVFYTMVYLDVLNTPTPKIPSSQPKQMHNHVSNSSLKKDFEKYLIHKGYKQYTPTGNPSTVYDYIKRIDDVCKTERMDWIELKNNIDFIIAQYDKGGSKAEFGNKSHRAVINALLRFQEFTNNQRI